MFTKTVKICIGESEKVKEAKTEIEKYNRLYREDLACQHNEDDTVTVRGANRFRNIKVTANSLDAAIFKWFHKRINGQEAEIE